MTVYVDDLRTHMKFKNYFGLWSGIWADTTEELNDMAAKIGLLDKKGKAPILDRGYVTERLMVTDQMRGWAIEKGAVEMRFGGGLMYKLLERKRNDPKHWKTRG